MKKSFVVCLAFIAITAIAVPAYADPNPAPASNHGVLPLPPFFKILIEFAEFIRYYINLIVVNLVAAVNFLVALLVCTLLNILILIFPQGNSLSVSVIANAVNSVSVPTLANILAEVTSSLTIDASVILFLLPKDLGLVKLNGPQIVKELQALNVPKISIQALLKVLCANVVAVLEIHLA